MKKAFQDMLHELGGVNLVHAYYNGSCTSKDTEDPSWSTSFKTRRTWKTSSALEALWKTLFVLYLYLVGTLMSLIDPRSPVMTSNNITFIASFIPLIMEYLVKISKKVRILELKRRHLKITVLTSNTPLGLNNLSLNDFQHVVSEPRGSRSRIYKGFCDTFKGLLKKSVRDLDLDWLCATRSMIGSFAVGDVCIDNWCKVTGNATVVTRCAYLQRVKYYLSSFVQDVVKVLELLDLIKIPGVDSHQLRMKVFPLLVADDAGQWWINDGGGKITTWEELVEKFFCKFYPESHNGEDEMLDEGDNWGIDPLEFI
ncbi:hypothetical protein Tco_1292185 [Tanacetum coccineum]